MIIKPSGQLLSNFVDVKFGVGFLEIKKTESVVQRIYKKESNRTEEQDLRVFQNVCSIFQELCQFSKSRSRYKL